MNRITLSWLLMGLVLLMGACSGGPSPSDGPAEREPVVLVESEGYVVTAHPVDLQLVELHGGEDVYYAATAERYTGVSGGMGEELTDTTDDPSQWEFHAASVDVGTDAPQLEGIVIQRVTPLQGWELRVEPEGVVESISRDPDQLSDARYSRPDLTQWRPVKFSGVQLTYIVGGAGPTEIVVGVPHETLYLKADLDVLSE